MKKETKNMLIGIIAKEIQLKLEETDHLRTFGSPKISKVLIDIVLQEIEDLKDAILEITGIDKE